MKRGFVHNKVTKVDQLLKLRESLKGHAKKLVPVSLTQDIDEAWVEDGNFEILGYLKAF